MKADFKALFKIFSNISYVFSSKQKKKCIYIAVLVLLGSLLETIGVSIILPFVQAMLNPEELLSNRLFSAVVEILQLEDSDSIVIVMGIGMIMVYVIKNLFLTFSSYEQIRFRWKMQRELSTRMLESYMCRPYAYFLDANSAQVLRGITADVNSLYTIVENMFVCLSYVLTIGMVGIFLFATDFILAITVLIVAGMCFLVITFGFRKRLSGVGQRQRMANEEQNKYAYQAVNGIKEIDVLQRQNFFVNQYNNAYIKAEKENVKFYFLNSCPGRIIEAVCVSGIIAIVCLQYGAGNIDGSFVSKMAIFVVGAFKILPLTGNLVGMANHLVYYWAGVDATYNNLREAERVAQETREYISQHNAYRQYVEEITMENNLCINNISWHYPNSDKQVLTGLSLEIHKNEAIALIGCSGAGKTTLSDIILGLYKPQEGSVMIDGIDIFTIPTQWSRLVGYVPQSVFLLDDTIRANVTFGLYEKDIDDVKVWDALERAQLASFIRELPEGINTRVGERGIKFSGGQRQRIAIARALYYDPEILVLDEATSALDNETEKAVMDAIESLQGEKTLIIIAHRLSTIKNCDKIYEIIDGKAKLRDKDEVLN